MTGIVSLYISERLRNEVSYQLSLTKHANFHIGFIVMYF